MTRIRRLGAVALATPLAIGLTVIGVTEPAQAESGITSPGQPVTHGSSITVSAKIDNVVRADLQVAPPGAGYETIDSGGNLLGTTRLSNGVDIPRNGVYSVRLKGGVTGKIYDSSTFRVRIPPAAPNGLQSTTSGKKVILKWNRGAEDDLTGYQVAARGVSARNASTAAVCSGATCTTTLAVPDGSSGEVGVYVRALRSDGSGGLLKSSISAAAVNVGGGTNGGAVPTSGTGAGSGTSVPGAPSVNPLNPLQSNSPITLPSVTPDGGTTGFQYPTPAPEVAGPNDSAPQAKNVSATSSLEWGKSLAVALILLIVAAHLGMRTRRIRMAEASGGRGGRAGGSRARVREARKQIAQAEAAAKSDAQPQARSADVADTRVVDASAAKSTTKPRAKTGPVTPSAPPNQAGATDGRSAAKASGRHTNGGGYRGRRRAQ